MSSTQKNEELSLTVSRTIRAPRHRVFEAFASVEEMKKWFGPGECHVTGGEMNFHVGGSYRLGMYTSDFGEADLTGTFSEIVPGERIAYTWLWANNAAMEPWGRMSVTVQLNDHPEGTQVTIVHKGLRSPEIKDGHNDGWDGSFDKLKRCFGGDQTK